MDADREAYWELEEEYFEYILEFRAKKLTNLDVML